MTSGAGGSAAWAEPATPASRTAATIVVAAARSIPVIDLMRTLSFRAQRATTATGYPASELLGRWEVVTPACPWGTILAVEDKTRDDAEHSGPHQDVADHDEVDATDGVRDCKGQDRSDRDQDDGSADEHGCYLSSLESFSTVAVLAASCRWRPLSPRPPAPAAAPDPIRVAAVRGPPR